MKKLPMLLLSLAIFILIISGGYSYYRYEKKIIRQEQYSNLRTIADLKISQITKWREDRLADANVIAKSPFVRQNFQRWLLSQDSTLGKDLLEQFALLRYNYKYEDVIMVSAGGKLLLDLNANLKHIDSEISDYCKKALQDKKAFLSDLYFSPAHDTIHFDIFAPILNDRNVAAAVLVLRVNPFDYLYPLIQSWPTSSKSAETLIIRRDGDSILYVNELRHVSNTALKLRIPLANNEVPAVQAVLGHTGIFEGVDYRGVRVLSDMHPVPGTPWFMIAKVDQSEIFSELKYITVIDIIITLLLLMFFGIGISWFYNIRQKNIYRNLLETGTALQESQEEFRATLYSIGDAVITTDLKGCIRNMNTVAEKLTSWKESDVVGRTIEDVFRIVNEESHDKVESPVQRVLKEGLVVGLANHTLLISKDGNEIPIADSGAPIRNEKGDITGVVLVFRDQTQEHSAQRALEESEEKFRIIFEKSTIGKSLTLPDGKLFGVNKAFADMLGRSIEEMHLVNFAEITHPDDIAESRECIRSLLEDERSTYRMEKRYQNKNGNFIWTDVSTTLLRDKNGVPVNFITSISDISDRKQTEITLRASENRFRITVGSLTDVVYEWDLKEKVDWFGDIDGILGYPTNGFPRTLSGWVTKLHPEDSGRVIAAIEGHLKRSEPYIIEYRVMNNEGDWRWWSARGTALRDEQNSPYWWIGSITDITESKLAEEVIKNNEKRFRELIESLPQLFWTCRVDGPCDYLSRQWVEYTGIPEAEQLGYRWLEQLHPEDRDGTVTEWMGKVKTGMSFDIEFRIRRKDGVYRWFKTRAIPMRDGEGNIIKWFGSNTDFDEIKKAEERLRKLNRIYSLLSDINQAIVRTRVPGELFKQVCNIAVQQGGFGMAWIGLIDESSQKLKVIAQAGKFDNYFENIDISLNCEPLNNFPIGNTLHDGKHKICNIIENEEMAPSQKIAYELGFRSSASFPLKVSDILKGALTFYSDEQDFFDEAEVKLLDELALDISFAMEYAEKEAGRKQAEIMLREEKDRVRNILDLVGDPIFVKDNDHLVTLANRAFYDIFCLDENSVIGYTLVEAVPENERQHFLEVDRRVLDTGITDVREEELTVKGLTRTIITRKKCFSDESGKRFLVGTIHDITDRKLAEMVLRDSEARYKTLVENIPQKIFMKSRDFKWMSINNNFARDLGVTPEEIVGKMDRDLFSVELADKYHTDDVRIIKTGKTEELEEKYMVDGKETWVNTIRTPVWDDKGEIVGLLGIFWDITGRKLAEEEIRKLNMELEDRVVLRTAQLEATNKELEAFSYSVSHDLRAPLRHVSGYVELLKKHLQSDLSEKGRHYLDSITDSAHVMGVLIDDLLQFSRNGRTEMHQSDFNMNEIVKEVTESLRKDNPDRKIEWELGKLPSIHGDEAMLRLVWINLLSNAVKFTRKRKKARIEIGAREEKKELVFYVRDNGVGFDMQYAQKLFGVFQRLHPTEEFEGTGVGLANVRRIILRHGGRTWAESEPDKGAVFYFSIPKK